MRLALAVMAAAIVLTACSRLDALHVQNTCDFPVTVMVAAQDEVAIETVGPRSERVVLEGLWRQDAYGPTVIAVEIAYRTSIGLQGLPDLRTSLPPATCDRSRIDVPLAAVINIGWQNRASTFSVAGPPERIQAFAEAVAEITDASASLDRPTQNAAHLTVWPDRDDPDLAGGLMHALRGSSPLTLRTCSGGSPCFGGPIGSDEPIPAISLPAAERPEPWAPWVAGTLVLGGAVAIWGSTRQRRKAGT